MSSVRLVPAWRLPVLALANAPQRRRLIVLVGALVLLAGLALVMLDPTRFMSHAGARAGASSALAAARARAVARAGAAAAARVHVAPPAAKAAPPGRVVATTAPAALFATHSWYVAPPPPPPVAAAPPPPPSAPPFPYTYVGSYAPSGETPVYFLSRGDRVFDAHVGDRLDGVFEFEKVEGGQLVFNYLPLNIRQNLPAGVSP